MPHRAAELPNRGLTVAEIASALSMSERTVYRFIGISAGSPSGATKAVAD